MQSGWDDTKDINTHLKIMWSLANDKMIRAFWTNGLFKWPCWTMFFNHNDLRDLFSDPDRSSTDQGRTLLVIRSSDLGFYTMKMMYRIKHIMKDTLFGLFRSPPMYILVVIYRIYCLNTKSKNYIISFHTRFNSMLTYSCVLGWPTWPHSWTNRARSHWKGASRPPWLKEV